MFLALVTMRFADLGEVDPSYMIRQRRIYTTKLAMCELLCARSFCCETQGEKRYSNFDALRRRAGLIWLWRASATNGSTVEGQIISKHWRIDFAIYNFCWLVWNNMMAKIEKNTWKKYSRSDGLGIWVCCSMSARWYVSIYTISDLSLCDKQ